MPDLTRPGSAGRWPWIALAASGALALALGFGPTPERRIGWFVAFALPIVLANLAGLAVVAYAVARRGLAGGWRPSRDDLISALVLAAAIAAIALIIPGRMRIQADEYLVAGTALGIWLNGTPQVVTAALIDAGGAIQPLYLFPDKRGVLFPLLMALSDGRGPPAWQHGLVLNLVFGWTALLGLYAVLRRKLSPAVALCGALALAASPVFGWACRSILLEPLNLTLLATTALVALHAARTRRVDLAMLLAVLAPLLPQARYESVLAAGPALAASALLLTRAGAGARAWAVIVAAPLLLLPFAWQRAVEFSHGLDQVGATEAFTLGHLIDNARIALEFFGAPSLLNPVAPLLALGAMIGAVVALRGLRRTRNAEAAVAFGAAAVVAAITGVVLAYAWGDLQNSVTARLGLPALTLYCAAFAHGVAACLARVPRARDASALTLAGAVLALSLPWMRHEYIWDGMQIGRPLNRVDEWLRAGYPACRPLIVSAYAPYFAANGYSATSVDNLVRHWSEWFPRGGRPEFRTVLFVELRDTEHGRLLPSNTVPEPLVGRDVLDEPITPATALRVFEMRRAGGAREPVPKCP